MNIKSLNQDKDISKVESYMDGSKNYDELFDSSSFASCSPAKGGRPCPCQKHPGKNNVKIEKK